MLLGTSKLLARCVPLVAVSVSGVHESVHVRERQGCREQAMVQMPQRLCAVDLNRCLPISKTSLCRNKHPEAATPTHPIALESQNINESINKSMVMCARQWLMPHELRSVADGPGP